MNKILKFINGIGKIKHFKYNGEVTFSDGYVYNANIITYGKNKKDALKNIKRDNKFLSNGKFKKEFLKEIN